MATLNYVYDGPRTIEGINQARAVHNAAAAAEGLAQNPPVIVAPLSRNEFLAMCLDNAIRSWKRRFADEIDAALAAPETKTIADAKAAIRAKAGDIDAP